MAVEASLLHAWLAARSVARSLPAPVPDHGGFRVDTNSDTELCRWVYPRIEPSLTELGRAISAPGYLLKVCGSADELRATLPSRWQLQPTSYFMITTRSWEGRALPAGYVIEVERDEKRTHVQIRSQRGDLAASGYAAGTKKAFVYDRIITVPEHRRRGLGHAVMTVLRQYRENSGIPELLVATEDGRALYTSLGWEIMSPYSTGFIK